MLSIIVGILASVLPNVLFALLYFKHSKAPHEIVRCFYWAEIFKFVALVLLLSIFLQLPNLSVPRFFSAFLLSEMTLLFYKFFILTRTTTR